jgi:pimeloyl-ACP methyl ester carboxylesterase
MDSPPLVLLHGGNANSGMWLRNLADWSRDFRVYAIDTVGDPGFSATNRLPYHNGAHVLWLADVFASLDLETVSIVGASFGGWIGLEYALRNANAVDGLVLLAPAGIARASIAATLEISVLMLLGAWGRRRALVRGLGIADEGNLADHERMFLEFCGVVQLNALSRLKIPSPIPDEQLKKLSVRTLAVVSGKDIFFDSNVMYRRLSDIGPNVTVRLFPDAGHASVNPSDLVRDFLSKV